MKKKHKSKKKLNEIKDYNDQETTSFIDENQALSFKEIGLKLPKTPPTQVISIRLPTKILNELRSLSSEKDIPYQALIKMFLADSVKRAKKKSA